jgi:hypothetical protein
MNSLDAAYGLMNRTGATGLVDGLFRTSCGLASENATRANLDEPSEQTFVGIDCPLRLLLWHVRAVSRKMCGEGLQRAIWSLVAVRMSPVTGICTVTENTTYLFWFYPVPAQDWLLGKNAFALSVVRRLWRKIFGCQTDGGAIIAISGFGEPPVTESLMTGPPFGCSGCEVEQLDPGLGSRQRLPQVFLGDFVSKLPPVSTDRDFSGAFIARRTQFSVYIWRMFLTRAVDIRNDGSSNVALFRPDPVVLVLPPRREEIRASAAKHLTVAAPGRPELRRIAFKAFGYRACPSSRMSSAAARAPPDLPRTSCSARSKGPVSPSLKSS